MIEIEISIFGGASPLDVRKALDADREFQRVARRITQQFGGEGVDKPLVYVREVQTYGSVTFTEEES